eukprot:GGOE01037049.1.p1 GENE.GGOE01037049.1~~GGOE01037049.1.p1  ORF type:complete len:751 (-),score=80.13 GGOE01037049.1:213-2465(-)
MNVPNMFFEDDDVRQVISPQKTLPLLHSSTTPSGSNSLLPICGFGPMGMPSAHITLKQQLVGSTPPLGGATLPVAAMDPRPADMDSRLLCIRAQATDGSVAFGPKQSVPSGHSTKCDPSAISRTQSHSLQEKTACQPSSGTLHCGPGGNSMALQAMSGFVAAGSHRQLQFSPQALQRALQTAAEVEVMAAGWLSQLPSCAVSDAETEAAEVHDDIGRNPAHSNLELSCSCKADDCSVFMDCGRDAALGGFVAAGNRRALTASPEAFARAMATATEVDRLAEQWLSHLTSDILEPALDPNLVVRRKSQRQVGGRRMEVCHSFGQAMQVVTEIATSLRDINPLRQRPQAELPIEPTGGAQPLGSLEPFDGCFVKAGSGAKVTVSAAALSSAQLKAMQAEHCAAQWLSQIKECDGEPAADEGVGGSALHELKPELNSTNLNKANTAGELQDSFSDVGVANHLLSKTSKSGGQQATLGLAPGSMPSGFATAGSQRTLNISREAYAHAVAVAKQEEANSETWLSLLPLPGSTADVSDNHHPEREPGDVGASVFFTEDEGTEQPDDGIGNEPPSAAGNPDQPVDSFEMPFGELGETVCSVYDMEPETQVAAAECSGDGDPSPPETVADQPMAEATSTIAAGDSPPQKPPKPRRLSTGLPPSTSSLRLQRPFSLPRSTSERVEGTTPTGGDAVVPTPAKGPGCGPRRTIGVGIKRPRDNPEGPTPEGMPTPPAEGTILQDAKKSKSRHLGIRLRKSL